jgi:hypothetical protein
MANRLKAYVKRIILASATEGAYPAKRRTAESTLSAFRDASHGTDSGWWSDLIYTTDVLKMFNRYRSECAEIITADLADYGLKMGDLVNARQDGDLTYADLIVACASRKPMTWEMYCDNDDKAYAATFSIRYAVESLVHVVASEMEIEL